MWAAIARQLGTLIDHTLFIGRCFPGQAQVVFHETSKAFDWKLNASALRVAVAIRAFCRHTAHVI